jgi:hypothetical protein
MQQDPFDPVLDDWPRVEDSPQRWVDFAVSMGVARRAATAMSKPDLIKCLTRLDTSSE